MMPFLPRLTAAQSEMLVVALAATAVFTAILAVAWPYLFATSRAERLRRIRDERETIRVRERAARLGASPTLRQSAGTPMQRALARLRFRKAAAEPGESRTVVLAATLRKAGFRDQSAVQTYLAAQVVLPVAMVGLALIWAYVLRDRPPGGLTLAAVLGVAAVLGHFGPGIYVKNATQKRQKAILKTWPDALDLLLICVEAGMTIETALRRVAEEMAGTAQELASELNLTTAELAYLQDRSQAFRNLGERTGLHSVRSVVSSLLQSEKYGTSLATSLRVISQEQRDQRLIDAEKKAAALPPKLTVPMIVFFLPVLFVVILVPAAIRFME